MIERGAEWSVKICIHESQSQAVVCHGAEHLGSHPSCLVTQGTVNVAGPLALLTQHMLINLRFEGLDLTDLWYPRGLVNEKPLWLISREIRGPGPTASAAVVLLRYLSPGLLRTGV